MSEDAKIWSWPLERPEPYVEPHVVDSGNGTVCPPVQRHAGPIGRRRHNDCYYYHPHQYALVSAISSWIAAAIVLMIHSMVATIFFSDRLIVLSARLGSVQELLEVKRPRERMGTRFRRMREMFLELLGERTSYNRDCKLFRDGGPLPDALLARSRK